MRLGREGAVAGGAIVLGVALLAWVIPAGISMTASQSGEMSPAFMPRLVAFFLMAIGAWGLVGLWLLRGSEAPGEAAEEGEHPSRAAVAILFLLGWPFAVHFLGFAAVVALSTTAVQLYLDPDWSRPAMTLARALVCAVVVTLGILGLFEHVLGVPLSGARF